MVILVTLHHWQCRHYVVPQRQNPTTPVIHRHVQDGRKTQLYGDNVHRISWPAKQLCAPEERLRSTGFPPPPAEDNSLLPPAILHPSFLLVLQYCFHIHATKDPRFDIYARAVVLFGFVDNQITDHPCLYALNLLVELIITRSPDNYASDLRLDEETSNLVMWVLHGCRNHKDSNNELPDISPGIRNASE